MIQQGIEAFRAGRRAEARQIFAVVVQQNPNDERAWQWMYNVADNDSERLDCLKQILRINPRNEKANQFLTKITNPEEVSPKTSIPVQTRPKNNQQQSILIAVGIILVLCCCSIAFWSFLSSSNDDDNSEPTPTLPVRAPLILPTSAPNIGCNPSYPDVCITHDQPCEELRSIGISNFRVLPPDPFELDRDADGIGCED